MNYLLALIVLFALAAPVYAQTNNDNDIDVNAVMNAAQQFANDNLDDDVLQALQNVDRQKVEDFLKNYQEYLNGDYVLDLDQVKDAATVILPILDAHEETQPYAAWLRSRMDYFEAAEAMQSASPSPVPPPPGTNAPAPSLAQTNAPVRENPPFQTEQAVWTREVAPRPWPKAAVEMVPRLKPIFASEQVPPELVWLGEAESGFNPGARSPSGAVGVFQLTPDTAKSLGLSLSPRDQRRQPEASGAAAAKYLHQLHDQFGDWRLAVAAYNCGAGTVQKRQRRYGTSYEDIATHLPAETQKYVPKVEALIQHREGQELENLKAPPE